MACLETSPVRFHEFTKVVDTVYIIIHVKNGIFEASKSRKSKIPGALSNKYKFCHYPYSNYRPVVINRSGFVGIVILGNGALQITHLHSSKVLPCCDELIARGK